MEFEHDITPLDPALAERLAQSDRLPTLPAVALELLRLVRNPEAGIDELVEAIGNDPTCAARLVRRANAAYYGRRIEVETLKDAAVFLGLNESLSTALSVTMLPSLRKDPLQGLDYEHFWQRSLISAAAGRLFGSVLLKGRGEVLFLSALLQDIGMLVVQRVFPGTYVMDLEQQKRHAEVLEIEQRKLWVDHAAIGAWTLDHWGMPRRIVRAVAASHEPAGLPAFDEEPAFFNAAAATGLMADLWLSHAEEGDISADIARLTELLDCDARQLFELAGALDDEVADAAALFQIDLAEALAASTLLERLGDST